VKTSNLIYVDVAMCWPTSMWCIVLVFFYFVVCPGEQTFISTEVYGKLCTGIHAVSFQCFLTLCKLCIVCIYGWVGHDGISTAVYRTPWVDFTEFNHKEKLFMWLFHYLEL
jgi:hypothetical protein